MDQSCAVKISRFCGREWEKEAGTEKIKSPPQAWIACGGLWKNSGTKVSQTWDKSRPGWF